MFSMSVLGTRSKQSTMTTLRAVTQSRAFFIVSSGIIYAIAIIAATLTLNAYFAQTWDVKTFIQAAHRFLDGGNPFDLYAQSRAAQTWPYAYPPLHAFVTAIFLWVGSAVPILPDYVWARVPELLADIGVGITLYTIVERKSSDESLARHAVLLWLFNPVTFYNTAVQGHFESEWILFILLAYMWLDESRGIILPTIALVIAVLFKQVAILFAIPLWVMSLRGAPRRSNLQDNWWTSSILRTVFSFLLFTLFIGAVCLPYLLYSNDFVYMNLTYLENVPVQTQSWLVGVLALTRPAPDSLTSDFFLFRYQSLLAIVAALAISFFAIRSGLSLYLTAALVAIAFILLSKKVMGYYYVMAFPFLFAEALPRRRFGLALFAIILTTWISLSPYYAPWSNPDHIWIYAILGTTNSALFLWLFIRTFPSRWQRYGEKSSWNSENNQRVMDSPSPYQGEGTGGVLAFDPRPILFATLALFAGSALAALMQPFAPDSGSPIRAPIIAPGAEVTALFAFGALMALMLIGMWAISRKIGNVPRAAWGMVLIFAPLFFVVYYLTKESTALFELVLKTFGV